MLKVTISVRYTPPSDFTLPSPPYYHPATSVTLTCYAHSAVGTVTYRWSSTCSSCFASSSTSQTVSESILKSNSAGEHRCTATDSVRNTGSNSTQMKLIGMYIILYILHYFSIYVFLTGAGLYVDGSPAPNNTFISGFSSRYSTYNVYCYSNSTSTSVGYFRFPNGGRYYSSYPDYHYISRQNPSGIYMYKRSGTYLQSYGIFTCELPDSEGNIVETSLGIYSSIPSKDTIKTIKILV